MYLSYKLFVELIESNFGKISANVSSNNFFCSISSLSHLFPFSPLPSPLLSSLLWSTKICMLDHLIKSYKLLFYFFLIFCLSDWGEGMWAEGKEEEYEAGRERGAEKKHLKKQWLKFSFLWFTSFWFFNLFNNFHLTLFYNLHSCTNIPYLFIFYVHLSLPVLVKFIVAILKPSLAKSNILVTSEFIFIDYL